MQWKTDLIRHAKSLGREVHVSDFGVGIDFADGSDAFWFLPGEVSSTMPLAREAEVGSVELIAAYTALDSLRTKALHILRHHLATLEIAVSRHPSGQWQIEWKSGATSSISVGATLTLALKANANIQVCLAELLKRSWGIRAPTQQECEAYLARSDPTEIEIAPGARPQTGLFGSNMLTALMWMIFCKVIAILGGPDPSEKAVQKAVAPSGRIAKTLLRINSIAPELDVSIDALNGGTLHLKFSDGIASQEIDTRGHDFANLIGERGSNGAGEYIVERFKALDAARSHILRAIAVAATIRNWGQESIAFSLVDAEPRHYLGARNRDVEFPAGDSLTKAIESSETLPQAVKLILVGAPSDFVDDVIANLNATPDLPLFPPDRALIPRDIPEQPSLPTLTPDLVHQMDEWARQTLKDFLADDNTLWKYNDRDVYRPTLDHWVTQGDWIRLAESTLQQEYVPAISIIILRDAGDPRGDTLAAELLARCEPHDEVSDAEVEVVYRYRASHAETASKWFTPTDEDVPFAQTRARLGDPVAVRYASAATEDDMPVESTNPSVIARMSPTDQELAHQRALSWSSTSHRWAPADAEQISLAAAMGWRDVVEALPSNPFFLPGLLTQSRRPDQFDEPGILLSGDFVLKWSAFAPSLFLATLIVAVRQTDLVALARTAAEESAKRKPELANSLTMTFDAYAAWNAALQPPLAIAWTRCRPLIRR